MSKVRKGSVNELKAQKILEARGYLVEKTIRTRYKANQDFWSIGDLICIKKDSKFLIIQVKTNQVNCLTKLKNFAIEHLNLDHIELQVWVWHDYKGFKIYKLQQDYKWNNEKYIKGFAF